MTRDSLAELASLPHAGRRWVLRGLTRGQKRNIGCRWRLHAHHGQEPPNDDWRVWMMLAGRGFGKTRAGAEWVSQRAREGEHVRIALVGATIDDVDKVMIRGESGLMKVARIDEDILWVPSTRTITFQSGAKGFVYSGERPDMLRGPEHHYAWCDELAKWGRPEESWDNLMLGLRLGERPRAVVTTTPRPLAALRRIIEAPGTAVTGGRTADNPHLPAAFREAVERIYGGTRLGRQELGGELIEDFEGALWTRDMIEAARTDPLALPRARARGSLRHPPRASGPPPRAELGEDLRRIVVGVDPPASAAGVCGIVVCAIDAAGTAYLLDDRSVGGERPEGWARAVAEAVSDWGADRIIAEANQGGAMVEAVLRGARPELPVRLVHASRGKAARAEPIAALFEQGRVKIAGRFAALEDELCSLVIGGGHAGPGRSPDRADACVWALTELMLRKSGEPRVRGL